MFNADGPIFQGIDVPQEPKREGDPALFSCDVIARPQPDGFVKWSRDDKIINGGVFEEETGRFIYNILNVEKHHAGSYMCVAENEFGKSNTQALNFTVVCKFL